MFRNQGHSVSIGCAPKHEMSRPLTFPGSMLALPMLSAGCLNPFAYRFLNGASLA